MLKTKQQQVLEILKGKKYLVDSIDGKLYSFRKCDNEYKELVPTVLSSGFIQVILHPGKVNVYLHNLVWLSFIGEFNEDAIIRHKDGNKANNNLDNLYLDNLSVDEDPEDGRLTENDIESIKTMIAAYQDRSASSIARELGLKPQTVRYTIKKINDGQIFRFNKQGKQVNNENKAPKEQSGGDTAEHGVVSDNGSQNEEETRSL